MFQTLLDFVFPRRSLTGEAGTWITEEEARQLRSSPIEEEADVLRRLGLVHLDALRAAGSYKHSPLLAKALHTFKYKRMPGVSSALTQLLIDAPFTRAMHGAVLCPVPLHWVRRFHRGFNQAEIIARSIAGTTKLPVEHLLRRVRSTGHQAWRTRAERLRAVQDAFRIRAYDVPRHVILVDDVATTGATLDACAAALKDAGVTTVEAWVLARD